MFRKNLICTLIALLLGAGLWSSSAAEETSKRILVLGDASYLPAEAVAGAEIARELGEGDLMRFAVVILSNIAYSQLPGTVQEGLTGFVEQGGALLITGGPNGYGSGGYQPIAAILPFEIRTNDDWRVVPFREVIPLEPGHPILQEVTFRTVGSFNDLNPRRGATEIAQYAGAGVGFPSPLIAERYAGQGAVLGVALDLGQEVRGGWADGDRFVRNLLTYLLARAS